MSRKIPRWTTAFRRALERTGEAQAAAKDAGVDKSTAYARRRVHAEFAQAWATLDEATGYLIPPGWVRATPPEDEGEGDQPRAGG